MLDLEGFELLYEAVNRICDEQRIGRSRIMRICVIDTNVLLEVAGRQKKTTVDALLAMDDSLITDSVLAAAQNRGQWVEVDNRSAYTLPAYR